MSRSGPSNCPDAQFVTTSKVIIPGLHLIFPAVPKAFEYAGVLSSPSTNATIVFIPSQSSVNQSPN